MSIAEMREYLLRNTRVNSSWYKRVKAMAEDQVVAVYYSMKQRES